MVSVLQSIFTTIMKLVQSNEKKRVVILGHFLEVYVQKNCNAKMRTGNLSIFSNIKTNELNEVELLCRLNVKNIF